MCEKRDHAQSWPVTASRNGRRQLDPKFTGPVRGSLYRLDQGALRTRTFQMIESRLGCPALGCDSLPKRVELIRTLQRLLYGTVGHQKRKLAREISRKAQLLARPLQSLEEVKNIRRSTSAHRRDRIHRLVGVDPEDVARCLQDVFDDMAIAGANFGTRQETGHAGAYASRGVRPGTGDSFGAEPRHQIAQANACRDADVQGPL